MFDRLKASLGFGAAKPTTVPARTFAADPPYRSSSLTSQELAAYLPGMLSGDTASLYAKRLTLDRAQDLARNDPIAVAGIQRLVDMLVGAGLMLSARPDARAIGISRKAARAIGQTIESEWNLFWNDPLFRADHRRKVSGNGVFRLGARTMAVAGEATAAMRWRKAGVSRYRTCVQAIDPDRLSNPYGQPDSPGIARRRRIRRHRRGSGLSYHGRSSVRLVGRGKNRELDAHSARNSLGPSDLHSRL